ncbi:MAG TPA: hypothetical protein VGJ87_13810, partial [Roseiflexaceae bacterium]
DLYAGFYGADQHFFITLPLQHGLQAISFHLFGPGVLQARGVSVVAGMSIVWLVGLLAYRWYGLAPAVVCELLLVAWPSNLTAASNGLPLLGVARTARYDVLAVATGWIAIALLDATVHKPRAIRGVVLGACCGIAALSQFMGLFVLPLVFVNWLAARAPLRALVPVVCGCGVIVLPWLAYGAWYARDVAGQLSVYAGRGDFLRPEFYVDNITQEAGRYAHLLTRMDLSTLLLTIAIWPAVVYVIWRSLRSGSSGDHIVWSSLLVFAGLLLLLDHGKSSIYAIVLLPSICLCLARFSTSVLASAWPRLWLRLPACLVGIWIMIAVSLDGIGAYQITLMQAKQVSPYAEVGQQIERALAPRARVLGPERWWWATHTHPYLSLRSVWWQWGLASGPSLSDVDNIIVNDNVRADILLFPESVQQRFWTFIRMCTTRAAALDDPTYFGIDIYRVLRQSPAPEQCG